MATLASLTPVTRACCATSFILPWLIDPQHPQGMKPFANIHVGKYHIISPVKFGGRAVSWKPVLKHVEFRGDPQKNHMPPSRACGVSFWREGDIQSSCSKGLWLSPPIVLLVLSP